MVNKKNKVYQIKINKKNERKVDLDFSLPEICDEKQKKEEITKEKNVAIEEKHDTQTTEIISKNNIEKSLPKNIFLIWFGDKKPIYVDRVIAQYKQVNPDFNIQFIWKTKNEILYSTDVIINKCKQFILEAIDGKDTSIYSSHIRYLYYSKLNFIQILSDIYRFELLKENGGIYVDCDTWPIRSFDDTFLQKDGFSSIVLSFQNQLSRANNLKSNISSTYVIDNIFKYSDSSINNLYNDKYFFGLPKNFTYQVSFSSGYCRFNNTIKLAAIRNLEYVPQYLDIKNKFFNNVYIGSDLKQNNYYCINNITPILHFRENRWNTKIEENDIYSSYDDMIYFGKRIKIPKNIFFIWIGDKLPVYFDNVLSEYRRLNPTFNIKLYKFDQKDLENPKDVCLKKTIDAIHETIAGKHNLFSDFIQRYIDEGRKFSQIVSNLLRFILLDKFGGIYVDCDTYPIKPFDNELLNKMSFCPQIIAYRNKNTCQKDKEQFNINLFEDKKYFDLNYETNPDDYEKIMHNDIFFIGQCQNCISQKIIVFQKYPMIQNNCSEYITYIRNHENSLEFINMRKNFIEGIRINSNCGYEKNYIIHFCDRTWLPEDKKTVRSYNTKFDNLLNIIENKNKTIEEKIDIAIQEYFKNNI